MVEPMMPDLSPAATKKHAQGRLALQIAAVVAIAVALGAGLTFCAKTGPNADSGRPAGARSGSGGRGGGRPPTTVGTAKAVAGSIPIAISALGIVTPLATVNINARVSGALNVVMFHEGQMVRKGQLLAQIDPRPYELALQQATAQLQRDQASLHAAQLDLTRYQTLKAQDSIAGQTVDTQSALVRQDAATVSADQAGAASARLNLSFTRITSPVAGKVGLRLIDAGNQITANATTPIAIVTQVDPISVVFSLPEEDIPAISHRGEAGLAVTALDRAGGAVLATGALATLDNVIDTTTGTVKAKARFDNRAGTLFANQFVNVSLLVDTLQNQIIVPTTAVRHGPQGDYVWVLQPNQTVNSRPIKAGPATAETVSIASGLKAGETVITEGGDRLKDGGKVVLPGQNPALRGAASGRGGPGGWSGHRRGGRNPARADGGGSPGA